MSTIVMTWWLFAGSAVLLAIERILYIVIWHKPAAFRAFCAGLPGRFANEPVDVVQTLFVICKVIQAAVFAAWILVHGGGTIQPPAGGTVAIAIAVGLVAIGQTLNAGVFLRLGTAGVFYGNRFGRTVAWCDGFPFSVLAHPQYVGTVLSIWGLFLLMRFPHADWYLLPALETVYYAVGARYERS